MTTTSGGKSTAVIAFLRAETEAHPDAGRCGTSIGTRPSWMTEWQYQQCHCELPFGHEPATGPGTKDGHRCGAHDDDHPTAIEAFTR